MRNDEINWKRLSAEGAAIVVSILLAFSIDAWWDRRQDRAYEHSVLNTLASELQEIKVSIADIQDYQVAIRDSAYRLAELSEYPDRSVSDQEFDQLLEDQLWTASPENFSAPVLNAIVGRGDISLISNRDLQALLSVLPGKFKWISGSLQEDLNFTSNYLEPFAFKNHSYLHLGNADRQRPGKSGFVFPAATFSPRESFSHKTVVETREFQNLMLQRAAILEDVIGLARTPDLIGQIDEAIELIEGELEQ